MGNGNMLLALKYSAFCICVGVCVKWSFEKPNVLIYVHEKNALIMLFECAH